MEYPYDESDDFCVTMLELYGGDLFQIELLEYNKDINDIVKVYIVFNQRDGEILFKKYFISR